MSEATRNAGEVARDVRPKTKADLTLPSKPVVSASWIRPEQSGIVYSPELEKAMDDDMLNDRWYTLHQIAEKLGLGYTTIQARVKNEPGVRRGFGPPRIPYSLFVEICKRRKP